MAKKAVLKALLVRKRGLLEVFLSLVFMEDGTSKKLSEGETLLNWCLCEACKSKYMRQRLSLSSVFLALMS